MIAFKSKRFEIQLERDHPINQRMIEHVAGLVASAGEALKQPGLSREHKSDLAFAVDALQQNMSLIEDLTATMDQQSAMVAKMAINDLSLAAYLVGSRGVVHQQVFSVAKNHEIAQARKAQTSPEREKTIGEVIERVTAGWDGKKPTKMSASISAELCGLNFPISPKAVRDRMIKLGISEPRSSDRRTKKTAVRLTGELVKT